jgi:hypothetical protein
MVNAMNPLRRRVVGLLALLLASGAVTMGWCEIVQAGNTRMVEQRVWRMDQMNKRAVQGIPDLPKNGTVALKARASYQREELQFDIEDIAVTSTDESRDPFIHHQPGKETKADDSAKD